LRKSPSEWIAEAAKAKLPLELGEEAELQDDRVILGRVRAARRNGELVLYTSDPGDSRKLCGTAGIKAVVIGC
jgi:hypothetical protein